jgi:protein SCO1/2
MTTTSPQPEVVQPQNKRHQRWYWFLGIGFLLFGLFSGWLVIQFATGWPSLTPPSYNGMVLQSPERMGDFTLTSHTEEAVSLSDFRGKIVMLYFGYTYCPDVCPATLIELKNARNQLGKYADDVQIVMVSVDPQRDTPEVLASYLSYFDPSFVGLTGTEEELLAAATPYGVFFEAHEGTVETGYAIDHTAAVLVIDRDGYLRMMYPFGMTADQMAEDLAYLVRD